MKVIDLLNKIANGEEVPKKIFYKTGGEYTGGYYWIYDESCRDYIDKAGDYVFNAGNYHIIDMLNMEVEIIEEDKKIKKIEKLYKYIDKEVDEKEKDMYYENILKVYDDSEYEIDESMSFVVDKINEIIDYLEEKE